MKHSNEFLLPHTLTDIQHQVLIGGLLGDFSIGKACTSKYPRLKIDRQAIDEPYIEWEYNIFKNLCLSGIKHIERLDKRYNKSHKYVSFRTRAVPAFLDYYNKWYPNGIRQVPEDIEFTPLILSIWFADDGCVINEKNQCLTVKLSTESFGHTGAELLSSKLKKRYGENFPIFKKNKDKDQYFIKASTVASQKLLKEIEPHIINIGMIRKYEIWKNIDLNHKPLVGKKRLITEDLKNAMLNLEEFSVPQLAEKSSMLVGQIRPNLNKLFREKYLEKFESDDAYHLYHYRLTDLGKKYLHEYKT